jgi:hypothetical protein
MRGLAGIALQRWRTILAMVLAATVLALTTAAVLATNAGAARAIRAHSATSGAKYCADRTRVYRRSSTFIGVYASLDDRGPTDLQCTAGRIAATPIGYVRDEIDWWAVEPSRGVYYWAQNDQIMTALAEHHIAWLPDVEVAPPFAQQHVKAPHGGLIPPVPADFAAFMQILVKRYGPHGSFWRDHPKLHYDPIRAWQIWNEPSLEVYWAPHPNPAAYTALLRAAYRAIKRVDPHALVVSAGMPFVAGIDFYKRMYRDGARRDFNVLAFHPYSSKLVYAEEDLELLRAAMDRAGDRRKSIWITEFGWSNVGNSPFGAGASNPSRASRMISFLSTHRDSLGIARVFYYDWRDPASKPINWWGVNMGMYRSNSSARPVAKTVDSAARRLNR